MKIEAITIVFIQFLSEILQKCLLLQDFIMSESRLFSILQAQFTPPFLHPSAHPPFAPAAAACIS